MSNTLIETLHYSVKIRELQHTPSFRNQDKSNGGRALKWKLIQLLAIKHRVWKKLLVDPLLILAREHEEYIEDKTTLSFM